MNRSAITQTSVIKVNSTGTHHIDDWLAAEEPLEIRVNYWFKSAQLSDNVAITMRTPGQDRELTAGFLLAEGEPNIE